MVDYTDWDQYIASMNKGEAAGVIQGCWIMSSIQSAEDQSGKWAIVNMPALDGIDGATNYANCGGASWAVSSNCKNTELAFDFLKIVKLVHEVSNYFVIFHFLNLNIYI